MPEAEAKVLLKPSRLMEVKGCAVVFIKDRSYECRYRPMKEIVD